MSTAPHFHTPVPVLARFSSSTGLPDLADTDSNGNPRGLAVRFVLGERRHTDIIAHSANGFPSSNGEDFLSFFIAIKEGKVAEYLESHPKAAAFVQLPKPFPEHLWTEDYFGINAFKLVNGDGKATAVRYHIVASEGAKHLADHAVPSKDPNWLYGEIEDRLKERAIDFDLVAQIAQDDDATNDATIRWPDDRQKVLLGKISIQRPVENNEAEQKHSIFDPVPRVDGVEPSGDPLIGIRAAAYLISGKDRRAA